jgi:hypothetical protein
MVSAAQIGMRRTMSSLVAVREFLQHDPSDEPLLRALAELRELDRQARELPAESEPYRRSIERLQAKSREVFWLGGRDPWGAQDDPGKGADGWDDER